MEICQALISCESDHTAPEEIELARWELHYSGPLDQIPKQSIKVSTGRYWNAVARLVSDVYGLFILSISAGSSFLSAVNSHLSNCFEFLNRKLSSHDWSAHVKSQQTLDSWVELSASFNPPFWCGLQLEFHEDWCLPGVFSLSPVFCVMFRNHKNLTHFWTMNFVFSLQIHAFTFPQPMVATHLVEKQVFFSMFFFCADVRPLKILHF